MKNVLYGILLLSISSHCGGYIEEKPIEIESQPLMEEIEVKDDLVNLNKVIVTKKIVQKKIEKKVIEPIVNTLNYYIGLSLSRAIFDGSTNIGRLENGHPLGLVAKTGYIMSKNIALEGRIGKGIKDGIVNSIKNKWDRVLGIYLKPKIEIIDDVELFGLLGYGSVKQEINNVSITNKSLSYGTGLSYNFDELWSMDIDAVRYAHKGNDNMDAYSIGLSYKF